MKLSKRLFQMANIISGKRISQQIGEEISAKVAAYKQQYQSVPKLAVVLVGERTDSSTYVRMKQRAAAKLGIDFELMKFGTDVDEEILYHNIIELNDDDSVHGIIVQLPLPKHINEERIASAVRIDKDVDGFHMENIGRLALNRHPPFVACTPKGI